MLFGMDSQSAIARAQAGLEGQITSSQMTGKYLFPLYFEGRVEYHPTLKIFVGTIDPRADWEVFVDAQSGQILQRRNTIYYDAISGNSTGSIQPFTPYDNWVDRPFFDQDLYFDGYDPIATDINGNYNIELPGSDPIGVNVFFNGPFIQILNAAGSESYIQEMLTPPTTFDIYWDDNNSTPPERDAFYAAVTVHKYITTLDPALGVMDFPMVCNVNVAGTCNAFWSGWEQTINFYQEGGGCPNIAQIADVVYHEYGHGITDLQTRPAGPDGAMHEGFSDYTACTITNQSRVGLGFTGPNTFLRELDNNNHFPEDWSGESHNDGLIIGGALWHTRQILSPHNMGYVDSLWHFARYAQAQNFEDYFWAFVALDDNDGDLSNGTPNAAVIFSTFGDRHGIGPGTHITITADSLFDSEDTLSSHIVRAHINSVFALRPDSVFVYYNMGTGYMPLTMTREDTFWVAAIPPQHSGTNVDYYLLAVDQGGFRGISPANAPDSHYTFYIGPDRIPPTLAAVEGPPNTVNLFGPYGPFVISAYDINGIDPNGVRLHYRINSENENQASLLPAHFENRFVLESLNLNRQLVTGDIVHYYYTALDGANSPNTGRLPATGDFQLVMVTSETFENFERFGIDRWNSGPEWALYSPGYNGSQNAIWFSNPRYPDNADISISMNFGYDLSPYTRAQISLFHKNLIRAGDTCYVEASNNGGATWTRIAGISGISAQYSSGTYDIASILSPNAHDYRIRFRFISDASDNWVGIFLDDIGWIVGSETAIDDSETPIPEKFQLAQNYPNPFNPQTNISFSLPSKSNVRLEVFDLLGRRIKALADKSLEAGSYNFVWDGKDESDQQVSSGIYFYRLTTDFGVRQEKMTLLK